jgi:hypothetical protein
MAGQLTIFSAVIQGQSGTKQIGPLNINAANPILATDDYTFASATTDTIIVPSLATACIIAPPLGNLVGLTLSTSIPINPNMPTVLCFPLTPGVPPSFGLTSGGAVSGSVEVSFF